jgi:hypothetical protein
MKRSALLACACTVALFATGSAAGADSTSLQVYTAKVDRATVDKLVLEGYDVAAERRVTGGVQIDLVLSSSDLKRLKSTGIAVKVKRNAAGKTATQLAAEQAAAGFSVWRSWDEPGGIRDEIRRIAEQNRQIVKLAVIGHTLQGGRSSPSR